jgi:hypothetical protein
MKSWYQDSQLRFIEYWERQRHSAQYDAAQVPQSNSVIQLSYPG